MNTDLSWLVGENPEFARVTLIAEVPDVISVIRVDRMSWRTSDVIVPATAVLAYYADGTLTINGVREEREDYVLLCSLLEGDELAVGQYIDLPE